MKNFKEIAEKCLAGELKGTFKNAKGENISSEVLCRCSSKTYPYSYYHPHWICVTIHGDFFNSGKFSEYDIIDFIPDNIQEQIKIDIPEGKGPVMEQTENGIVITWKEKELTYAQIYEFLCKNRKIIHYIENPTENTEESLFIKKVNVLRKLTNIRNYFGKPKHDTYGHALYYTIERGIHTTPALYPSNDQRIIFDTKEHAEQAIKMLGDELKYLFEPW